MRKKNFGVWTNSTYQATKIASEKSFPFQLSEMGLKQQYDTLSTGEMGQNG